MYLPERCEKNKEVQMSRFKKLSHTLYECKYHVVICPKYRFKILRDELAEYFRQHIYSLASQKDLVEILEMNIQSDHVHMVLSIPPKYAVSQLIGFLRVKMSISLFYSYEKLGKRYWDRHFWSRGYCASIVGLDEEMIRKYVKYQDAKEKEVENT
jgi:putative transposase